MKNTYKIFGKFGVVDIFIGIAIIGIVVFLNWLSVPASSNATASEENIKKYIIEIKGIDEGLSSKLQVGEEIYDSLKGSSIGHVVAVEEKPYEIFADDVENKEFILSPVEGLSTCNITVEAQVVESSNATNVGSFQLMVGTQVYVKTKNFAGNGYIIMLER